MREIALKVICGAGNEDKEEVKRISFIYTLAGATLLDVSANPDVVRASVKGINLANNLDQNLILDNIMSHLLL